jgi:cellulose synthase/poly-beta-1,6-N-acetylglucosamine synthase-like glycosyltransferase
MNIDNLNIPTTYKNSLKQFNDFEIPMFHPILFNTGFAIDFENNTIYITDPEKKYHRIPLKVDEENMKYLRKEINNGAKATMITVIPPSYKKGKHRREEIIKNNRWRLHITLRKNVELLTKEEFKKFQRIAILGIDLNSMYGIGYAIWTWDRSNGIIREEEIEFIKSKIKPHFFQEKVLRKLQRNHGNSIKNNELFQRINKRIQRQNRDWTEKASKEIINIALQSIKKYNADIAIIAFENLANYKASSNNRKEVNKANNRWLRRIAKRTFEKALWSYPTKILAYKPIKNKKDLEQILINAYGTSKKCSKCGNYVEFISNNEIYCKHCNKHKNRHLNSAGNIARKTILDLCYFIDAFSPSRTCRSGGSGVGQGFLFIENPALET